MRNEEIEIAPLKARAASKWSAGPRGSVWPHGGTAGPSDFALALERDRSEAAVLVLAGELDLHRAPAVEAALAEAIGSDQDRDLTVSHLAVDIRLVTFIDSTTLAVLLAASRRQHGRGGQLLVLAGPQTPMTAFEVTGFDRLLTIRRSDDDPTTPYALEVARGLFESSASSLKRRNHNGNSRNN